MALDRATVSGWIREQNAAGSKPSFDARNIERLNTLRKPGLKERAERYILAAADKCATLQADFNPIQEELIGISYSHDAKEASILVHHLHDEGLLNHRASGICRVTPKGHIAADELRSKRAKASQGFVAMWFGDEMRAIYDDAIEPAITRAGYKSLRIDRKEDVVKIDDEILSEIRRSAFIVADFTEHRGGVYFEAGFAMGLDIPIVWTCHEDHMKDLHFDIRQYNCLGWRDATDFSVNLQKRIEGYLGRGPIVDTARAA
jgi:nucleoside 2-deoxyribosyltransferase